MWWWWGGSKSDLITVTQPAWPQQLGGFNLIWRGGGAAAAAGLSSRRT